MDGRGRAIDNVFTERLWRTPKYEEVYLKDYGSPREARRSIGQYFEFYNHRRPHQALDYRTPAEVYLSTGTARAARGEVIHRVEDPPKGGESSLRHPDPVS